MLNTCGLQSRFVYLFVYLLFFCTAAPSGFPRNFLASVVTTHSLSMVWNPPPPEDQNGDIIRYRVNVTVLGTMEMYQLLSVNNSITVLSLRPYTTYTFAIAAETAVGVGPFSGAYTVMTATDGKKHTSNISILIKIDKSGNCTRRVDYSKVSRCAPVTHALRTA